MVNGYKKCAKAFAIAFETRIISHLLRYTKTHAFSNML